jgi:hypothetical protein
MAVTEKRCGKLAVISSGYIDYLNAGGRWWRFGPYFSPSEIHSKELERGSLALGETPSVPEKGSSFTGLSCHQKGCGLGKVVESWYSKGIPPTTAK